MSILVGKKAPKFSATAVVNGKSVERNYNIEQFIGKKYVLLFFYTKDFSGICPSELHDFQDRLNQFKSKNVDQSFIVCYILVIGTPQFQSGKHNIRTSEQGNAAS